MMKQLFYILLMAVAITSCKKEKEEPSKAPVAFAALTNKDIKSLEASMSNAAITVSDDKGLIWRPGQKLIFKTNENRYGKMELTNIEPDKNYRYTISVTVFNDDGTVRKQTSGLVIEGTFTCDLDEAMVAADASKSDFHNRRPTATQDRFIPENGAIFMVYMY